MMMGRDHYNDDGKGSSLMMMRRDHYNDDGKG